MVKFVKFVKVELTGFADRLVVIFEREKKVKGNFEIFDLRS